ncbi:unnamed protein product, partial [Linum tenue]
PHQRSLSLPKKDHITSAGFLRIFHSLVRTVASATKVPGYQTTNKPRNNDPHDTNLRSRHE